VTNFYTFNLYLMLDEVEAFAVVAHVVDVVVPAWRIGFARLRQESSPDLARFVDGKKKKNVGVAVVVVAVVVD